MHFVQRIRIFWDVTSVKGLAQLNSHEIGNKYDFEKLVNKVKLRTYGGRGDTVPCILHLSRR